MTYGDVHRYLLRSVASRGILTIVETEQVRNNFSVDATIESLVQEINDEIRCLQQQVKIANDELTDEKLIIFLSLGDDETSRSQNVFSAKDLEYFRLIIEEIMSTDSRQITGINAMNIVNKIKVSSGKPGTLTKTNAQKLLDTWCNMRYLDKDENNYALGVRAIHEFESYLRRNMPDVIEDCVLCKKIVFRGYNCPGCGLAVHTRCLNRYLSKVNKWPCCKADFSQSQLDRLNAESSRLTQTQVLGDAAEQSAEYNTVVETTQQELMEDVEMNDLFPGLSQDTLVLSQLETQDTSQETSRDISQESVTETSQRASKKRKRQQR